jgi:hypothetical protein
VRTGGTARVVALFVVIGSLALGNAAAGAIDDALAVSFADKEPLVAAEREGSAVVLPADLPDQVTIDVAVAGDPLLDLAVRHVGASLEAGGAAVVDVSGTAADGSDGAVVAGSIRPGAGDGPGSYVLQRTGDRVDVAAPDLQGLAAGLFQLADHVDAGLGLDDVAAEPRTVAPALDKRFVDTGAVGMTADPTLYAPQDDYVHASGVLSDVVLDEAPWLDEARLAEIDAEWRTYIDRMVSYGYDGVVVPGFLEYVTFAGVGDGDDVYPEGSPYRERAEAMVEQVGAMWAYADTMGMDVVMVTDMLALTGPLAEHLEAQPGGLDADSGALWQVYRAGVDELLTELPFVDGVMIRIGEAGAVYNLEGWDYYSALEVTEDEQVRTMLRTFSDVAAEHDAEVYLRSWSVGVGEVGDLHTSPETYERVLGDLGPAQGVDNLVVSTKFVAGDFDSWLPLNPTLLAGPQDRIVEIQARREFEGFGAFPNDTTGDHAAALQRLDAANPALDGLWVWTQSGGPQRAGPMSLYLTAGFWQQWDLQVFTAARLGWDPQADRDTIERAWLRRTWSEDPQTVAALSSLLAGSREAVLQGLYIEPYAEQEVRAFGLEPPPMMWVFKWDLVGGDTSTWAAIYEASRGRVDEAVAGGDEAVRSVEAMQATLAGVDRSSFHDPAQYDALERSLVYEHDLLTTLATYREAMLRGYEWLDTGDPAAREAYERAATRYRSASAQHSSTWTGDLALPPYEFAAADTGLQRLEGAPAATRAARLLLVVAVLGLLLVPPLRRAAVLPWRLTREGWEDTAPWWRFLAIALPWTVVLGTHAAFGSFVSPVYAAVAAACLVLGGGAALTWRSVRSGAWEGSGVLTAAVAGPLLVGNLPLLAAVAWRGPVGAWAGFWTEPGSREVFVWTAVAAVVWLVVAPALTGAYRSRRRGVALSLRVVGRPVLVLGAVAGAVGLERSLTVLNDELQVLPGGLSRILGITVHLGVPTWLPAALVVVGLAALVGAALLQLWAGGAVEHHPGDDGWGWDPPHAPPGPAQPPAASMVSAASNHSAST